MKQEILVKLFNETPLTTDEILYVSNNLKEGEALASEAREYDHSSTSVFEACGLNDTEVEYYKEKIGEIMDSCKDEEGRGPISLFVERVEKAVMLDPLMLRMVIATYVKTSIARSVFEKGIKETLGDVLGLKKDDSEEDKKISEDFKKSIGKLRDIFKKKGNSEE